MTKENLKTITLVLAILETILAIPVLGWFITIGSCGVVSVLLLAGYITSLVIINKTRAKVDNKPYILGIICACIGWMPVIGWIGNIIMAVLLWKPETFDKFTKPELSDSVSFEDINAAPEPDTPEAKTNQDKTDSTSETDKK